MYFSDDGLTFEIVFKLLRLQDFAVNKLVASHFMEQDLFIQKLKSF